MKTPLALAILLALPLSAGTEEWTKKDGDTAKLKLLQVVSDGDVKVGIFENARGRKRAFLQEDFSEEDAKRLAEWKPGATSETAKTEEPLAPGSTAFDGMLDGNLVILKDGEFVKHEPAAKPTKHYVFYYTASWCPPCQAFTPSLVEFYNKHKQGNDTFELILVTSDDKEKAMLKYAKDKNMPWPHITHSEAKGIAKKLKHDVNGIPSVIICNLQGEIVSRNGRDLVELEKLLK